MLKIATFGKLQTVTINWVAFVDSEVKEEIFRTTKNLEFDLGLISADNLLTVEKFLAHSQLLKDSLITDRPPSKISIEREREFFYGLTKGD